MFFRNGFLQRSLWSPAKLVRLCLAAGCCALLVSSLLLFRYPSESLRRVGDTISTSWPLASPSHALEDYDRLASSNTTTSHPIDRLIADAHRLQESLLSQQSKVVPTAAVRYRERRCRHPPPVFD